jgi:type VI secretion system secreted protein Hcp
MGKLVDPSTPKLYQAMDQHERLTRVEFEWYAYNTSGIRELAFRIELENALVTRIRPSMPDYLDPAHDRYRFFEHVSLAYERIVWSHGQGDIQFEATWHREEA